jgi:hypothetical protein
LIQIDDTLISDTILEERFACNIDACKGACCIEGDKGAPLEKGEIDLISNNLSRILPYVDEEGRKHIEENGFFEEDFDGELVTQCLPDGRCVFTRRKSDGSLACGMEEAYYQKKSDFLKPISCHLYPIRIQQYEDFTALNYHEWDICKPACTKGSALNIKIYEFAKKALIRKFGEEWYEALKAADEYSQNSDFS